MIRKRDSNERGHADLGWLDSRHTFSFDTYFDPEHMGFRALRVLNEDRVAAGAGFPTHPHRDMEIITYILDGALEHKDSMGTGSVIRPGDVQRMSAGTGVTHSEFNPSKTSPVHFLQIWLVPASRGIQPSYEQKTFDRNRLLNNLCPVASGNKTEGAVGIHQDVELYACVIETGRTVRQTMSEDRFAWIQVARGEISINGINLAAGDGAAVSNESSLEVRGLEESEILLFDLG